MRLMLILVLGVLTLSMPGGASAQEDDASARVATQDEDIGQVTGPNAAEKLALARRFVAAMQVDQIGLITGAMTDSLSSEMTKTEIDPRDYERAIRVATARMTERIFDAMTPIYADVFTLEELQALVGFYESDIGRSAMSRAYEAVPRMTELMTELMPMMIRDMVVDMCAELKCTPDQLREAKAAAEGGAQDD